MGRQVSLEFYRKLPNGQLLGSVLTVILIGIGGSCARGAPSSGTATLVPTAYKTTYGKDNGQPVGTSIDVLDESGTTNNWSKYLQFQARSAQGTYAGSRDYYMTGDLASESMTNLTVKVNYLGPLSTLQVWTWYIHNWTKNSWDPIGTNTGTLGWTGWSILKFSPTGPPANYVRSGDGLIQLGTASNNAADDADIDYEAVIVTYSAKASK